MMNTREDYMPTSHLNVCLVCSPSEVALPVCLIYSHDQKLDISGQLSVPFALSAHTVNKMFAQRKTSI